MLPLRDNVPTRRFPVVTVALIAINAAVWILYELPHLNRAILDSGYFPCEPVHDCVAPGNPWWIDIFTAMFMHGGWEHILGNMLFLWIFGNNVEDTLGRPRFVAFYLAGGLFATLSQTIVTLEAGSRTAAQIPNVGASGAIAAVLGAYIVLLSRRARVHVGDPVLLLRAPRALVPLESGSCSSSVRGSQSLVAPEQGGGVAFFAHIGGFVFGLLAIRIFSAGRAQTRRPAY